MKNKAYRGLIRPAWGLIVSFISAISASGFASDPQEIILKKVCRKANEITQSDEWEKRESYRSRKRWLGYFGIPMAVGATAAMVNGSLDGNYDSSLYIAAIGGAVGLWAAVSNWFRTQEQNSIEIDLELAHQLSVYPRHYFPRNFQYERYKKQAHEHIMSTMIKRYHIPNSTTLIHSVPLLCGAALSVGGSYSNNTIVSLIGKGMMITAMHPLVHFATNQFCYGSGVVDEQERRAAVEMAFAIASTCPEEKWSLSHRAHIASLLQNQRLQGLKSEKQAQRVGTGHVLDESKKNVANTDAMREARIASFRKNVANTDAMREARIASFRKYDDIDVE